MATSYGKPIEDKKLRSDKIHSPAKGSKMSSSISRDDTMTDADPNQFKDYSSKGKQPKGSGKKQAKPKRANKEANRLNGMEF